MGLYDNVHFPSVDPRLIPGSPERNRMMNERLRRRNKNRRKRLKRNPKG